MPELAYSVAEYIISAKCPDLLNSSLDLENYLFYGSIMVLWKKYEPSMGMG